MEEAIRLKPFVPSSYVGFGDENEAIAYVVGAKAIWRQNEGALTWLRGRAAGVDVGGGPPSSGERCHKEVGAPENRMGVISTCPDAPGLHLEPGIGTRGHRSFSV
jgi:hypothetical protein